MDDESLPGDERRERHGISVGEQGSATQSQHDKTPSPRVFWYCLAILFFLRLTLIAMELPILRLVEQTVCEAYMGPDTGDIDEQACKTPAVQNKVAKIMGYKATFDALPCLLTALAYGLFSNQWGRRFVIMLSLTGQLMGWIWIAWLGFGSQGVPVEYIWVASLFLLLGGGDNVVLSMLYACITDTVPWKDRTRSFLFLHATDGAARLVGYPLGAIIMRYALWAPFALVGVIFALLYAVLWRMPESSPFLVAKPPKSYSALSTDDASGQEETELVGLIPTPPDISEGFCLQPLVFWRNPDIWVYMKHPALRIILAIFFFKRFSFASEAFAFQYISELLHQKIFETFWVGLFVNLGAIVTTTIILPYLTRSMSSPRKEGWVIRGSLIDLVIGFSIVWLSRSPFFFCLGLLVCGLGEGLEAGLQSVGSHIVGEANAAPFFTFTSMLGVASKILAGPLMAAAYAARNKEGQPLGICFLLSMIIFSVLLIASFFIKANRL